MLVVIEQNAVALEPRGELLSSLASAMVSMAAVSEIDRELLSVVHDTAVSRSFCVESSTTDMSNEMSKDEPMSCRTVFMELSL